MPRIQVNKSYHSWVRASHPAGQRNTVQANPHGLGAGRQSCSTEVTFPSRRRSLGALSNMVKATGERIVMGTALAFPVEK